ncbi:MAG: hypothetical protein JWO63_2236 [Frankiales bacterium]|jgi:hypothetical protein|nr:hypothetical protein [Frankiales bacterium]
MRRLFWTAFGASLGVLIFRKLSKAAEKLTPKGVASSVSSGLTELGFALRDFSDDVRAAMSSRESELRTAAGLDATGAGPDSTTA